MKKILLLLCAFVAYVSGAWGQEPANFANGASITPYTFTGETFYAENAARNTASELAKLVNGNDGDAGFFGGYQTRTGEDPYAYSDWFVNSFTIDMSGKSVTSYKTIEMIWTMATADKYKIYGGTTAVEARSKANLLVNEAAKTHQAAETKTYILSSAVSYPYLFFDFSEATTIGGDKTWGVQLREIKVIEDFTPALSSITLSQELIAQGSAVDVTASAFDQLSNAYTGSVTYSVSPTVGVSVSANVISFTAEATGTYTITGTDGNSNSATAKVYFFEAAPTLTNSGEDIELIQSAKSHSGAGTDYDGGYTAQTDWNLSGTKIFHATNVKKFYMTNPGIEADALTGYKKLHLKLFSSVAKNGVVVNMEGINAQKSFNVPAGEWTTIEVPFTGGSAASSWIWIKYTEPAESTDAEILVTDMYFSKDAAYVPMVIDSETDGVVAVHGDVKESDITSLSAVTASKLDLTGVSSWTATSAIESPNPNQIIVVGCTYTSTDAANPGVITPAINVANTKNVVAYTGYYFALTPIEITDNNSYQPWSESINTNYGSNGYTITRTVAANKYVSAYFPTTATNVSVTNGTIYELDATNSTTSEVKFNKVATIGGGAPFIVHTTGDATITVTGSGDLNMGENSGNTAQIAFASGAAFKGNLIAKAGTGVEWGLQSSIGAAPVFKQIGTGATIGAFRAYFTGLSATSSARAIFDDGDGTTAIKSIESIMNQDDVYYNLNGQRVLNPTKGLYIVNGKKVILK